MDETEALAEALAPVIKTYVEKATAPLLAMIAELEARKAPQGDPGPAGPQGPSGANGEGKEGAPGAPGRDGRDGLPGVQGERGSDGKDGREGIDGKDGLGFEDMSLAYDGERTIVVRFTRGELVKEFPLVMPILLDRGVWKQGDFAKGDAVSFGGSLWIAQRDTSDKPETTDAWRLSVKRGRDGKDGKNGERGAEGRAGRDLTPAYGR